LNNGSENKKSGREVKGKTIAQSLFLERQLRENTRLIVSVVDAGDVAQSKGDVLRVGHIVAVDVASLRQVPVLQQVIGFKETTTRSLIESSSSQVGLQSISRSQRWDARQQSSGLSGPLNQLRLGEVIVELTQTRVLESPPVERLGVTFESVERHQAIVEWILSAINQQVKVGLSQVVGSASDRVDAENVILSGTQEVARAAQSGTQDAILQQSNGQAVRG